MSGKWDKQNRSPAVLPANNITQANTLIEQAPQHGKARSGSSFAARFGRVILGHGIAAIPSALYHYQGKMKLKIQHIWLVSYILSHKWDEDLPYPSLKKMSRSTHTDLRYLQRIKSELCAAGYLQVGIRHSENQGQDTNTYDFSGLFERLESLIVADPPVSNMIREEGPLPELAEIAEVDSSFIARYGRIIVRRGVTAVPRAVFTHQAALGLTLQQVWFITYIFSFQWDTALPYPSLEKMAEHTGYSRTHLHEIKAELVAKNYLHLIPRTNAQGGRDSNAYDFSGLLDAIRAQLQPQAQRAAPKTSDEEDSKPKNEIPDLRRTRKTEASTSRLNTPVIGGGQKRTGGDGPENRRGDGQKHTPRGGQESTPGEGLYLTEGEGQKRLWGDGHETTERGGPRQTEKGGLEATSSVSYEPYQGTVNRLHKKETDNRESDKDDSNQISRSKKVSSLPDAQPKDPQPNYSAYIAQVAADFSYELQDTEHIVSNVTQALRLWQTSDLDEQGFVALMYEAKGLTRKYQTRPHWDSMSNKMSYYFTVVRDLIQRQDQL